MKSVTIHSPAEILSEALTQAARPFAKKLAPVLTRFAELDAAVAELAEARVKTAADQLMARAARGDEKAAAEIEAAGGIAGWERQRHELRASRERLRREFGTFTAPLWLELLAALRSAVAEAQAKIDAERAAVRELLGVALPPTEPLSCIQRNMENAERMLESGSLDPAFLLDGFGVREVLSRA